VGDEATSTDEVELDLRVDVSYPPVLSKSMKSNKNNNVLKGESRKNAYCLKLLGTLSYLGMQSLMTSLIFNLSQITVRWRQYDESLPWPPTSNL